MQISSISKTKATAIIVTILMVTSIAAMALPAQAQVEDHGGSPGGGYEGPSTIPAGQTADFTISSLAFLSVSPNPVGVGQMLLVNVWTTFPSGEGKYQVGYTVHITKPDGTTEDVNLKSYVADGTSWFTYVPTAVGQWTFVFKFAGEYFPAGYYTRGLYSTSRTGEFAGAIFNPSVYVTPATSNTVVITVQSDLVASWQSPLPTDYWSRPIQPNNREWYAIGGNYPWTYRMGGANAWNDEYYGPFIKAPDTPHILWEQQGALGGLIGGEAYQYPSSGNPGTPSVIYQGRCYQTMTIPINGLPTSCAVCYDLRTGKQYYAIPTASGGITPNHIAYWYPTTAGATSTVPGEAADLGLTVDLLVLSGSGTNMRLYKINPYTGAVTANVSLPALGNLEYFYRDGYVLSFNPITTNNVNNSGIVVGKSRTGFLVNWSVQGSSTNFASRIRSNISVTIPLSYRTLYQIGSYGDLGAYDPDTGISINQNRFIYGGYYGSSLEATNLVTGQALWNWTSDVNAMESAYRPTNAWCRHGIYVAEMERGYWQAWDERTGRVLWKSEMNDVPWGEFWMYDEAAFEDMILGVGYTGVWCLNETNGNIVWHYNDPAVPFETPYTSANGTASSYSVQNIRIADGKVYVQNSEHTPSYPSTRGWGLICLNVTTGEKLWKIMGTAMGPGPAADGYMVVASSYDGYMRVLGKGPSQTTVEAPKTTVAKGNSVLIQGTVMDMSIASPNTPAIADAYMDTWMDYLHLQMPIDGIYHNITVKGVPVLLLAIDSNGNPVNIGETTSDSSGAYQIAWTPPNEGIYKITATFAGSSSYGSSWAETGLNVGPAPTTPETPTYPTPIDYTMTIIGAAIAIIVVVILVGVLIIMRKK
jgi:hypothetical protein